MSKNRQQVGALVSTVASQQGGRRFESPLSSVCVVSLCMHGFSSGTPVSFHSLKTCVSGELISPNWLCVSPAMGWRPVCLSRCHPRVEKAGIEDGWLSINTHLSLHLFQNDIFILEMMKKMQFLFCLRFFTTFFTNNKLWFILFCSGMYINIGCVLFIFICMMHESTICARLDKHEFLCSYAETKAALHGSSFNFIPSTVTPAYSTFFHGFKSRKINKDTFNWRAAVRV